MTALRRLRRGDVKGRQVCPGAPLGDHGRSCRPIQQIELLGKLMLAAETFTCLNTEALQILKGA
jgi:hypothetical protein